jgi:hypothetical protein
VNDPVRRPGIYAGFFSILAELDEVGQSFRSELLSIEITRQ